jgi:hypothetical protein
MYNSVVKGQKSWFMQAYDRGVEGISIMTHVQNNSFACLIAAAIILGSSFVTGASNFGYHLGPPFWWRFRYT